MADQQWARLARYRPRQAKPVEVVVTRRQWVAALFEGVSEPRVAPGTEQEVVDDALRSGALETEQYDEWLQQFSTTNGMTQVLRSLRRTFRGFARRTGRKHA